MTARALFVRLVSAFVCVVPGLRAQEPGRTAIPELVATADSAVAAVMDGYRVPGAAVVVVESGRTLLLKGYGVADVETGRPVDPDSTVFPVASLSKPVTASAVLRAADAGLLDLHAPIERYPIRVRTESSFSQPVTTARLLDHTAGFDRRILGRMTRDPSDLGELGAYLERRMPPVVRPPGALSVYSNHGYALAGHVLEAVDGRPFARVVEEGVFRPLGMERTTFESGPDVEAATATGYGWSGTEGPPAPPVHVRTVPASGLRTTAGDLSRWMRAILNGGAVDGVRILSPKRSRQMLRRQHVDHPLLPGRTYGLAEGGRFEPPEVLHSAGLPGFTGALVLHEELELGVLVLLNSRAPPWGIVRAILGRYEGRTSDRAAPAFLDEPVPTDHLAGYYRSAEMPHRGPARIGGLVDQVRIRAPEPGRIEWNGEGYRAVDSLAFRRVGGEAVVAFTGDDGGIHYALRSGGEYERVTWLRSFPAQAGLWLGFVGVFLLGAGWVGVRLLRGASDRGGTREPAAPRWPLAATGGAAALHLAFVIAFAIGMARVMGGDTVLDLGLPGWLRAAFLLPPAAALLTGVAAWGALRGWTRGWGSPRTRAGLTLLVAALLAFLPFLASWDLLGPAG